MNERIKELAYAAKLDEHMRWTSDEGNKLPDEMIKFAELLIQECMLQCRQVWYDTNNDPVLNAETDPRLVGIKIGVKQGALKCISQVGKHFGVER